MKYEGRRDIVGNSRMGKKKDPHQIHPDDPIMTSKLWAVPEMYPAFNRWRKGLNWSGS